MSKLWFLAVAVFVGAAALPASVDAQVLDDRFDTYANGSPIAGQGGWETWDNNPTANTTVTNQQAFSTPNSLLITGAADIVHQFTGVTAGTWYVKTFVRIPSTQTGESFVILLNTYAPGGPYNWSAQVAFCRTGCSTTNVQAGMVSSLGGSEVTTTGYAPMLLDQWVELRFVINLATNQYQIFYNGTQFYSAAWTQTAPVRIQAIDLFSNASTNTFMDNAWLDTTLPVTGTGFSIE